MLNEETVTRVKLAIYGMIADTGAIPNSMELAQATGLAETSVREAFSRLHVKRLLVPEPGDSSRNPNGSAILRHSDGVSCRCNGQALLANCIWDAYGIALHTDAIIPARDGYSGEAFDT